MPRWLPSPEAAKSEMINPTIIAFCGEIFARFTVSTL
jgi:hypothetical protein